MSSNDVIDITKIIQRKKMVSELVDGIPITATDKEAADFKYLLKRFLEDNFMLQVNYSRELDRMEILDPEGKPLCDVGFGPQRVFILHPDNYIGSSKEVTDMAHSYQLISNFCVSWNKFMEESEDSID